MNFKCGLLRFVITLIVVNTFEYRKITTDASGVVNVRNTHKLQSRSLLFPPTAPTRVQLIGGIGIPVEDLHFESVTSGYVFKAEYFLPEAADSLRQKLKPQTIHRRRKSVNQADIYEENFTNVSLLAERKKRIFSNQVLNFSHSNKTPIHKSYLQEPVDNNFKNQPRHRTVYRWIVYKAIETILNKSALNGHICMLRSICEHAAIPLSYEGGIIAEILHIILTPSTSRDDWVTSYHKDYIKAEILGRSGKDCVRAFSQCTKSPMEIISAVFET